MRFKGVAVSLLSMSMAVGAAVLSPQATAAVDSVGLWPTTFTSGQDPADCGRWRLDANGFCIANDVRNGLEVGTRFRTSTSVQITGVRIYRVDPGAVRASLWTADGTLLARGTFAGGGDDGWQDMTFSQPVTIEPGQTYIASYFTPATKYAFDYGYFSDAARTVGPITALRSVAGSPNGVHCYDDDASCSYPVRGHRDSSYFVTPLWVDPGGGPVTPPAGDEPGAPRVRVITPSASASGIAPGTRIKVSFSEPVRRSTLTKATVRLSLKGSSKPVRVRMHYDAAHNRLVLTPRFALRRGTTYGVQISTGVRDLSGHRLDQDPKRAGAQPASWTFSTRR